MNRRILFSQAGLSLVSVLIASAIAAFIAVVVGSITADIFGASNRAARVTEIDNSLRVVAAAILNQQTCDNALIDAANQKIAFAGSATLADMAPIQRIDMNDGSLPVGAPTNPVALSTGQRLGFRDSPTGSIVNVASINYREINPGQGRGQVVRNGETFTTYLGEVVIEYEIPTLLTKAFRPRTIPLCIATDTAGRFAFCCGSIGAQALCETIGGTMVGPNCTTVPIRNFTCSDASNLSTGQPDCPASSDPNCQATYYISGFAPNLVPICSCQLTCSSPPGGGTSVPGPGPVAPIKGFKGF